jgi:hypothetical protein
MAYFYNKQGLKTKKLSQSTINQIKQKYPKINFDFNQFKYGLPDSHPNYYSVRNLDPARIKRKLEIRKTPEYRERRKVQAKKYYTTNKPVILKKLKEQYRTPEGQRKYNIQLERRLKQLATEVGFFPTGTKNPELNLWHDLYRASQAIKANPDPNRRFILEEKYLKNVPSNKETKRPSWSMNDYYKNVRFLDTKTGQRIKLNDKIKGEGTTLKNFLNNTIGKEENKKNVYENALKGYQFKNTLKNQKINYKGTDERLGTILQKLATQKQKTITGKNSLIFSALEVHHPYGVQNKFWNNEVAFRDANRELRVIDSNLKRIFDSAKDETEQKKVIGSFTKQVQKLPGGINYFFNDQNLGNVSPTSESILKAASKTYKDPIFTKAINKLVSSANFKSLVKGGALPSVAAAAGLYGINKIAGDSNISFVGTANASEFEKQRANELQTAQADEQVAQTYDEYPELENVYASSTVSDAPYATTPKPQVTPITQVADAASAAKFADELIYDDVRKIFVKKDDPTVKANQSDVLYWIADNPITESPITSIGVSGAALSVPGAKETFEAARKAEKGILKSTASVLGKGLLRLGAPGPTALLEIPFLAKQIQEGEGAYDILSNPLNYLGPAFIETLSTKAGALKAGEKVAERGILGGIADSLKFKGVRTPAKVSPGLLNTILRLGLPARAIAGIQSGGVYGLIGATALTAGELAYKYSQGELDDLFSSEGQDTGELFSPPTTLDTTGIMGLKNAT